MCGHCGNPIKEGAREEACAVLACPLCGDCWETVGYCGPERHPEFAAGLEKHADYYRNLARRR